MKYYLHFTKEETEKANNVTNSRDAEEQIPLQAAALQSHVHNPHVNHVSKETIRVKPLILSHSTKKPLFYARNGYFYELNFRNGAVCKILSDNLIYKSLY